MIQGRLGESSSSGLIESGPERSKPSVPSPSPSPSSSATAAPPTTSGNLRCPRCDSTNTKFCYYNNYNLTQPRHFCKTCRRYWTKGGALRNVPIGGGCRKNRTTATANIISSSPISKSNAVKFQKSEIGKPGNNFISSLELNPVFWAPPQNSHLLSLLRPNPNPNESIFFEPAAQHISNSETAVASGALSGLGWRNNQQQQNGFTIEDLQSSGLMHDFYQRLRSSSTNYNNHHQVLGNSSTNSTILESAAVGVGDQLGYWNNPLLSNWSDLPATTHGAYP